MAIDPDNILFKTTVLGMLLDTEGAIDPWVTFSRGWFEGVAIPSEGDVITNHSERALNLLIEQYKDSTILKILLSIYVDQIQEIEYVLNDILNSRNLDVAVGAQLDIIGDRVGESRNFKNDIDYRDAIRFRIYINASNGESEVLIEAVKTIGKASTVYYSEPYPATVMLQYQSAFTPPTDMANRIKNIAPAGVRVLIGWQFSDVEIFAFDAEGGLQADRNTAGFNEGAYGDGGAFMELLT